jgi:hypothetical protein
VVGVRYVGMAFALATFLAILAIWYFKPADEHKKLLFDVRGDDDNDDDNDNDKGGAG